MQMNLPFFYYPQGMANTGESKMATARGALAKRDRPSPKHPDGERSSDFLRYLEREVWPKAPPEQLGRRLSRNEEDEILGYGPSGV